MKVRYITNYLSKSKFNKEINMKESIYKSYDELPLFLNAETISKLFGISSTTVYELMHTKDFPVLKLGNRMIVSKERFKEWVDKNSGGNP